MIKLTMALSLLVAAIVMTATEYAPRVDEYLQAPCLELSIVDPRFERTVDPETGKEGVTLYFRQWRNKIDEECVLVEAAHLWLFNGSSEATAVYYADDGLPFQPRTNTVEGVRISRELRTQMPDVAYNFKTVTFTSIVYMERHGRKLPYEAGLEVPIPQRAASLEPNNNAFNY